MKASDLRAGRNTSFLLKSSPGFGKTIAACSAAIYGEVFLAYFDKAEPTELIAFYRKHRPELLERIDIEIYGSGNANEYLNKLISFRKEGCKYAAVITDSATYLTSAAVNWSMGFRGGGRKDKAKGSGPSDPAVIPDFDDYKVETSLVTQALDIGRNLDTMTIWTAHPIPTLKVESKGAGQIGRVATTQSIVSYGAKIGAMIPGAFSEIYHFGRDGNSRVVFTDMVGDDYAKTSITLPRTFDITDKLFFEVWQEKVDIARKEAENGNLDPFANDVGVGSSKWG